MIATSFWKDHKSQATRDHESHDALESALDALDGCFYKVIIITSGS